MSEIQEIEKELREYLEKEPNLRREDRLAYLTTIFHKHMELKKLDHVVNNNDYLRILDQAKGVYIRMTLPVRISRKELLANDALHVAVLESFLGYLNRNNLLRRLVKFDYTD